eukprot:TRINITY_DN42843_c0_g1_i3.p1 TRINITY_DN42843_c0_g1~~TRINITY_DN42843_c0_g1_i3.p1  ORF type:complete len:501 (+),score=63.16 TRINITY_DN42843_c0_g1_i3:89-1591(+)
MGNVTEGLLSHEPAWPEAGFRSGTLEFGDLVGSGAQGRVYLAKNVNTKEDFAVKVTRQRQPCKLLPTSEIDLFKKAGDSPYLVRVLGSFKDQQFDFMIMEKLDSTLRLGLRAIWKETRDEETYLQNIGHECLKRIIRHVVSGVKHLHSNQIVHRDIKMRNILTDRDDIREPSTRFLLADMGLSALLPERTLIVGARLGTFKYWAPELFAARYDHTVDNFAIGVLMFVTATFHYPFLNQEETCGLDVFEAGRVPDEMEESAKDFLKVALSKEPQKRQTHDLVTHYWFSTPSKSKTCGSSPKGEMFPSSAALAQHCRAQVTGSMQAPKHWASELFTPRTCAPDEGSDPLDLGRVPSTRSSVPDDGRGMMPGLEMRDGQPAAVKLSKLTGPMLATISASAPRHDADCDISTAATSFDSADRLAELSLVPKDALRLPPFSLDLAFPPTRPAVTAAGFADDGVCDYHRDLDLCMDLAEKMKPRVPECRQANPGLLGIGRSRRFDV